MMVDLFVYDGQNIHLNQKEVLLIKEFSQLWSSEDYGKCKEDKTGKKHIKADRFFKYLWLAHDYKSPYMELTRREREKTAIEDSGLDIKDVEHGLAKAAVNKYSNLQETRTLKLLNTANNTIDKIREFFDSVDLHQMDEKREKYIHSTKDIFNQLKDVGEVSSSLKDLEYTVKKEKEAEVALRGDDTEEGLFD